MSVDLLVPFPPDKRPDLIHPLVLAYLGDAVYEMYVRQYLISQPNHKPDHLNREAVNWVSAKAQARLLEAWRPYLTEEEADIARRGRNAKSQRQPKSAHVLEYRASTGFECLIGYWHLTGRTDRLVSMLKRTFEDGLAWPGAAGDEAADHAAELDDKGGDQS
jgi:ribonuclease-3 family protein